MSTSLKWRKVFVFIYFGVSLTGDIPIHGIFRFTDISIRSLDEGVLSPGEETTGEYIWLHGHGGCCVAAGFSSFSWEYSVMCERNPD